MNAADVKETYVRYDSLLIPNTKFNRDPSSSLNIEKYRHTVPITL
jgi:hypothetical protein